MKNNKFYIYIIMSICLLGIVLPSFASVNFQNNLIKTEIKKSSDNSARITLYTSKPYSDKVIVNKKGDREYVILLPETANSLISRPVTSEGMSVSVKTQPYAKGIKGYTKIIINTVKPLEITSSVKTYSSNFKAQDYSELLAQSNNKNSSKKVLPNNQNFTKIVTDKAKISKNIDKQNNDLKLKNNKTELAKKATKSTASDSKFKKNNLLNSSKTLNKSDKNIKISKDNEKNTEKRINNIQKQDVVEDNIQESTVPDITPSSEQISPEQIPLEQAASEQNSKNYVNSIQKYLSKIKKIVIDNKYSVAILSLILILLFVMIKRKNKGSKTANFAEINNDLQVNNDSQIVTPLDEINTELDRINDSPIEDVYVDDNSAENIEPSRAEQINELFDTPTLEPEKTTFEQNLSRDLDNQNAEEPIIDETSQILQENAEGEENEVDNLLEHNVDDYVEQEGETEYANELSPEQVENLKENEEIQLEKDVIEEQPAQADDEFVISKFLIDDFKGFYLVDFEGSTALVGMINDEIFLLKKFDYEVNAPLQARLDEQNGASSKYLVKVAGFKGLVEVCDNEIKLLIEL